METKREAGFLHTVDSGKYGGKAYPDGSPPL